MFKCPDLVSKVRKMTMRWTLETHNLDSWLLKNQNTAQNGTRKEKRRRKRRNFYEIIFFLPTNKIIHLDNFFLLILICLVNSLKINLKFQHTSIHLLLQTIPSFIHYSFLRIKTSIFKFFLTVLEGRRNGGSRLQNRSFRSARISRIREEQSRTNTQSGRRWVEERANK